MQIRKGEQAGSSVQELGQLETGRTNKILGEISRTNGLEAPDLRFKGGKTSGGE